MDVTERKRAEDALQQAQAELAHVTRVMTLGELAASIAHEVNQPLTAVINNSEYRVAETYTGPKKADMSESPLISIVDDDDAVRTSMLRLISSAGFRAEAFATAEDFLHAGRRQDTACLIIDVRMPGMSGFELQRRLTKVHCPISIIFITAHEDDETRPQALRAGAVAFLIKPFSDEVLLRAVQSALQSSQENVIRRQD